MKLTCTLAVLSTLVLAGSVTAEDGRVPQSTLADLGLGSMEIASDDAGMAVRGMGGATAWGTSLVSGLLIDPNTKSFIFGTDTNMSGASSAGNSKHGSYAFQSNQSYVDLSLIVDTSVSSYAGFLYGGAGGSSVASGK